MPTILTHPAVPLAIGLGLGSNIIPKRLLIAGVVASVIPDLDVISSSFGIPYTSAFSHRGFTHSIEFAVTLGILAALAWRHFRTSATTAFMFVFAACVSHGLLDSLTNGGNGIALLWPFSNERFFAPWRVIQVSPIGIGPIFSMRGLRVITSEVLWVWMPAVIIGFTLSIATMSLSPHLARRRKLRGDPQPAAPQAGAKKPAAQPGTMKSIPQIDAKKKSNRVW